MNSEAMTTFFENSYWKVMKNVTNIHEKYEIYMEVYKEGVRMHVAKTFQKIFKKEKKTVQ